MNSFVGFLFADDGSIRYIFRADLPSDAGFRFGSDIAAYCWIDPKAIPAEWKNQRHIRSAHQEAFR